MTFGTILTLAVVAVLVALVIRSMWNNRKSGGCACGGNCGACGGHCHDSQH